MHALLRYTLDLFGDDALASPVVAAAPLATPVTPATLVRGPFVAGQPLDQAIEHAHFRHPRASRESRLGDALVAYEFTRAKRRTSGFMVGPEGLVVRAPRWTPLYEVEAALQEKSAWVLRKLQESQERQQRLESARIVWQDGAQLPYLGGMIRLVLDPGLQSRGAGAQLLAPSDTALTSIPGLHLRLADTATAQQIRDAAQSWLMRQARDNFQARLEHFAPLLGVQWKKFRLSSAGTRWGSASADGSVRLNWRLIHFRQPVIDYVVAHELSHLRVMDHSPRFWDTVASVLPDYASLRRQLKDDAVPKW